ncbi:MAG: methyltransferase domain-containing protein [Pseudomonadota bacterium]
MLTDTGALARNRSRARGDSLFLQELAADELQDRVKMVNRSFTDVAIVTPFPHVWESRMPDAKILQESDALELEEGRHDLVVHALSLHWANDPVGQIIQCRRSLQPDGLFVAASLGGRTLAELRSALAEAEVALSSGLSPRVAPMAEIRDLGTLLQRAGLSLPVADSLTVPATYRDLSHLMQDLRAMGETNALLKRTRRMTQRRLINHASRLYQEHFTAADGRITATFEFVFLAGWAPAASQPKPLRPGSAQQRLADVLAVPETSLRD